MPRGRALQFDVRYVVRSVPARWTRATAQVFVTLTRGANVLRFNTKTAQTETGTWRWVVKGALVRIPESYPAGRYTVRGARRGAPRRQARRQCRARLARHRPLTAARQNVVC